MPDSADVIAIHEALLEAVQEASEGVTESDVDPVPPFGLKLAEGGFSETAVPAPAWEMAKVCPPIVSDPDRWLEELFAAAA